MTCPMDAAASKAYGKDAVQIESDAYKHVNDKYREDYLIPMMVAQTVLAGIIGAMAYIKQAEILDKQVALTDRSVVVAEEYLVLSQANYNNITVPTWTRQRDLFDRYRTEFEDRENEYVAEAFRLKEYAPDHDLQRGRALGSVQARFDRAEKQRLRQIGKYNRGRACSDSLQFSIMRALASVDAANHGYRYEEAFKREIDKWYWMRQTDGVKIVAGMQQNVISGINGGAGVATAGINAVGNAVGKFQDGIGQKAAALANQADFYGGIANSMFQLAGYGAGRSAGNAFGSASQGGSHSFGAMSSGPNNVSSSHTFGTMPGFSTVPGVSNISTENFWAEQGMN